MPNFQILKSPQRRTRRYKVNATGEAGSALNGLDGGTSIGRLVTIGDDLNVQVIDLCDDATGEVRTYRAEFLEEITE
jgi:hypothetical protein